MNKRISFKVPERVRVSNQLMCETVLKNAKKKVFELLEKFSVPQLTRGSHLTPVTQISRGDIFDCSR